MSDQLAGISSVPLEGPDAHTHVWGPFGCYCGALRCAHETPRNATSKEVARYGVKRARDLAQHDRCRKPALMGDCCAEHCL